MRPTDIRYIVVHCSATRASQPYPPKPWSVTIRRGASTRQATTSTSAAQESSAPCAPSLRWAPTSSATTAAATACATKAA